MSGIVPGTPELKAETSTNQSGSRVHTRRGLQAVLLVLYLMVSMQAPTFAQSAPSPGRKTSTPYTGDLSIFDSPGRDERLHVDRVMDMLGIKPGRSVADIGAGSGWFTVRAARRVTHTGTVFAVDINPKAVEYVNQRAQRENLGNIKTILSTADDPKLPAGSVDSVLLLKTYHEVANPVALLTNLRPALRAGARLGIIDRNGNGSDHGVDKQIVVKEAEHAGYKLVSDSDFVKDDRMDYFLILEVK
jgi:SAM-dependent methyltransferase